MIDEINKAMEVLYFVKDNYSFEYISNLFNIDQNIIDYYQKYYSEKYQEYERIVGKIKVLAKKRNYEKIKEIAYQYSNIAIIQKEYLKLLLKSKNEHNLEEALDICSKEEFLDNANIQLYHIHILNDQKKYEEAEKIMRLPKFKNNNLIQEQLINFLRKDIERNPNHLEKNLEEAKNIWHQDIFYRDFHVNFAYINLMMDIKNYQKVIEIASQKYFINSGLIQTQKIIALQKLNKNDEALQIMESNKFKKDYWVRIQYLKYLVQNHDFQKAQEILNVFPLKGNKLAQNIFEKNKNLINIFQIDPILEKIKNSEINLEDLKDTEYSSFYQLAFYDHENYPESIVLKELKNVLLLVQDNEEALKNVKKLKNYLMTKNHIFNIELYKNVLNSLNNKLTR